MVKLIRLQGDAAISNTEIHNTFREPIIIQPNSKVALIGISANMAQDLGNSLFTITGVADGRFSIYPDTATDFAEGQVDSGTWTLNQMKTKFEEACNYSLDSLEYFGQNFNPYEGLDHQILYDGKFSIWTHLSKLQDTDFETEWTQSTKAIINPSNNGFEASGGLVGIRQNTSIVPRVYGSMSATLENADTVRYELYAAKNDVGTVALGLIADSGLYSYTVNGVTNSVADASGQIVASAGDQVKIEKVGGALVIILLNSVGAPIGGGDPINQNPGYYYYQNVFTKNGNNQILRWSLLVEDGGTISDVQTTSIFNHYAGLSTAVEDDIVSAVLEFAFDVGTTLINNTTLSTYMGFSGDTNPIAYDGSPAKLTAPEPPQGLSENAGVIVAIDGLGKLDSHDGSSFSRSMSNMLYVLNTPDVLGQLLQIDVAAPFYLNMDNKFPINVNELRVRFLTVAGGTVLKFIAKPSLTILIDG